MKSVGEGAVPFRMGTSASSVQGQSGTDIAHGGTSGESARSPLTGIRSWPTHQQSTSHSAHT
eukprot:775934-Amphidinium_carterae.2